VILTTVLSIDKINIKAHISFSKVVKLSCTVLAWETGPRCYRSTASPTWVVF